MTGAEEQYLDETKYRSTVNGVRVALMTDAAAKEVELRFETPNGAGSFWTTLRPAATSKPAAPTKPAATRSRRRTGPVGKVGPTTWAGPYQARPTP